MFSNIIKGYSNEPVDTVESTYWFVTKSNASAVSHTGGAADTYLTNNANTTVSYNPNSKPVIWNPATSKFDVSSNKIGDVIHFTAKGSFNNLAAQEIDLFISVAEGTSTAHEHQINHAYYKTAKVGSGIVFTYHMESDSDLRLQNPHL